MILQTHCPSCQRGIKVPADVEIPCPYCARRVFVSAAEFSGRGAPRWRIACAMVALPVLGWLSLEGCSKRPWGAAPEVAHVTGVEGPAAGAKVKVKVNVNADAVSAAKHFVQGLVRDTGTVEYGEWQHFDAGSRHIATADITASGGAGGPLRSTWVFSFDNASGELMSVLVDGKRLYDEGP